MIISYNKFLNEGLFNFSSKYISDEQALAIFEDMKINFNNDMDLNKIHIIKKTGDDIASFLYEFYVGKKEITVSINRDYNRLLFKYQDDYKNFKDNYLIISKRVGKRIVNYFINEYVKQYPQFKKSCYLIPSNLKTFKKYGKPIIMIAHERSINNEYCFMNVFDKRKINTIKHFIKTHGAVYGMSKDNKEILYYFNMENTNSSIDPYGEEDFISEEIIKHITSTTYDELLDEQDKYLKDLR